MRCRGVPPLGSSQPPGGTHFPQTTRPGFSKSAPVSFAAKSRTVSFDRVSRAERRCTRARRRALFFIETLRPVFVPYGPSASAVGAYSDAAAHILDSATARSIVSAYRRLPSLGHLHRARVPPPASLAWPLPRPVPGAIPHQRRDRLLHLVHLLPRRLDLFAELPPRAPLPRAPSPIAAPPRKPRHLPPGPSARRKRPDDAPTTPPRPPGMDAPFAVAVDGASSRVSRTPPPQPP